MRVVALIQGRLGSSRLPAKLALDIAGKPLLARVADRARMSSGLSSVAVATSDLPEDDITASIAKSIGLDVVRGSLPDARSRFLSGARKMEADVLIRLTADNPYVEPSFIDTLIEDKVANPACPYIVHDLEAVVHGTASELIDVVQLEETARRVISDHEREHITPALRALPASRTLAPPADLADPQLSLTVDTLEDYIAVCRVHARFGNNPDSLRQIVAAYRSDLGHDMPVRRRS
jgi:spore coat polysaccharide biosynthesis protein SpsF